MFPEKTKTFFLAIWHWHQFLYLSPSPRQDCFEGVSPSSDENVKGILEKACKALIEAKAEHLALVFNGIGC